MEEINHKRERQERFDALKQIVEPIMEGFESKFGEVPKPSVESHTGAITLRQKVGVLDSGHDILSHVRFTIEGEGYQDLIITNMTVLPHQAQGKGYGHDVVEVVKSAVDVSDTIKRLYAVQVSDPKAGAFWEAQGFMAAPEAPYFGYTYVKGSESKE